MNTTTPTGIAIIDCDRCGHRHPATRSHCDECGQASAFIRPDGVCIHCDMPGRDEWTQP